MTIREAEPEDARELAALLAELGYPDEDETVRERARAFAADRSSFLLVAERDGRLVGLASASVMPLLHERGSWCRLSALVVSRDSRRLGIGRQLVSGVEARARGAGCRYLEVTSGGRPDREAAHAFYEALGLEQVSRRYLREL
ncbi:MAG TPA: GNAT family N-acetyltransferase [Gaiellaceae bacterium]|nr:GNAT family N-acetyltransferase [Gaiellaceae bacterium]